jgi:hypothetical protein
MDDNAPRQTNDADDSTYTIVFMPYFRFREHLTLPKRGRQGNLKAWQTAAIQPET